MHLKFCSLTNSSLLCCSKPLSWFQRNVYEWDPFFKFPNRIIGTLIISLIGLYMVSINRTSRSQWLSQSSIEFILSFHQMTLADYSLSDVVFDKLDNWKDTLKQVTTSCNQTEALALMIPQLEEFIHVARSKLFFYFV